MKRVGWDGTEVGASGGQIWVQRRVPMVLQTKRKPQRMRLVVLTTKRLRLRKLRMRWLLSPYEEIRWRVGRRNRRDIKFIERQDHRYSRTFGSRKMKIIMVATSWCSRSRLLRAFVQVPWSSCGNYEASPWLLARVQYQIGFWQPPCHYGCGQ